MLTVDRDHLTRYIDDGKVLGIHTMEVSEIAGSLPFGDLIAVKWFDASEAAGKLEDGRWDTPVQSVGCFLGINAVDYGMQNLFRAHAHFQCLFDFLQMNNDIHTFFVSE